MKNDFLPKTLNGAPGSRACLNINIGQMSTELHYHDCPEIVYVRRGSVRVFFDNGWREISCGMLVFMPPYCIHRFVSQDDFAEQVVIGFTDELICDGGFAGKGILCPYRSGVISTGFILSADECIDIPKKMDRLFEIAYSREPWAQLSVSSEALSVYSDIYGVWQRRGILSAMRVDSPVTSEIKKYISENFASKISAVELSRHMNISYSYLAKLMIREFGMSLGDYIISCRIENAKKLLLSTRSSIAEIGYECGFASSSAFICHFKKLTGKTPLAYRNEAFEKFSKK